MEPLYLQFRELYLVCLAEWTCRAMIHINNMVKGWRSDMKIVNVKVIKSNRAVYCKILTDEGIIVWGKVEHGDFWMPVHRQ